MVLLQGFRTLPRSDAVGAVGEPELLGQECRGSLLGTSQMEEDAEEVKSGQVCGCGSELFGRFNSLKTPVRLKLLLGPKAENELEWMPGLTASMGLQRPELSEPSLSTDVMWFRHLPGPEPPGLLS